MDILRNTIEAIFYGTPIEVFSDTISDYPNEGLLLEQIKESIKWIDKSFTQSEIDLLDEVLNNQWMCFKGSTNYSLINRVLLILAHFSRQALKCNVNSYPLVDFDFLLRWRQLSLHIGEDTMTLPFVAQYDADRKLQRHDLLWANVLDHNNFRINSIIDDELSDTHSHINAATDIFEFNWLCLMNSNFHDSNAGNRDFMNNGMQMEYDRVHRFNRNCLSLEEWCVIASSIRLLLFCETYGLPTKINRNIIISAFNDKTLLYDLEEITKTDIIGKYEDALPTYNDLIIDYAIRKSDFADDIPASPFMIHYGERKLTYDWYRKYYLNVAQAWNNSDLMLLYQVIKIHVRREFVQTNTIVGFKNFQDYQKVKSRFTPVNDINVRKFREIQFLYAVQSSLSTSFTHNLEARVCPKDLTVFTFADYQRSIFGKNLILDNTSNPKVTLVAHFIKRQDHIPAVEFEPRHKKLRTDLIAESRSLVEFYRSIKIRSEKVRSPLVGIDAASSELACRPEVFAPFFRYVRFNGLPNFTFHAGEDFYDIVDGLRTIYETIYFLGYKVGDRIGHGLALGLNPHRFYESRHNTVIIPKQTLLDNLVWLKYFAAINDILLSPRTMLFIDEYFHKLTSDLNYPASAQISAYWESMKLRGDYLEELAYDNAEEYLSDDVLYSICSNGKNASIEAKKLYEHYEFSQECKLKGNKPEIVVFPPLFPQDIINVQNKLLDELENKGIVIETNPSSNIKIGRFSRYDEHPITIFHSITKTDSSRSMVVSINTDDKGVFATSLRNEYSLIAISLKKMNNADGSRKWSDLQIENYLRRIAHYGNISRFKS